ncbi:hypothetical protein [Pontibacter populi]|uniref:SWFGD domain-containing protein n=1 Tax=Pontibacter populi TaxID=890055 RepID=A0ABV1RY35_9BACT
MNYNTPDRYDRSRGSYQTHRSERYRHPEQQSNRYRFDDYGDAAHGGYGNEGYSGTFGNQGIESGGSRHVANRGSSTYATSQNYGNMGSYGGAQGFGSARSGYGSQRTFHSGSQFDSGHGRNRGEAYYQREPEQHRHYGYLSDYDSHGQTAGNYDHDPGNHDLYGDYNPRRFKGADQGHYNFDRDNYQSHSYGGNRGNYMGSGYERTPRRNEYGATQGDYGSAGQYIGRSYNQPYGMSGYYQGGYYDDTDYNSYARDRDERSNDW